MKTYHSRFFPARRPVGLLPLLWLLLVALAAGAQPRNVYDWGVLNRLGSTTLASSGNTTFPPSFNQAESLAADAAGNVLIGGVYDPDVIFGAPTPRYQSGQGPISTLEGGYLAKYTPAGTLAWSLDLSSPGNVRVTDVALDAAGNSYAIGLYYQQLRIVGNVVALAASANACFLTKISPAGIPLWTITIESSTPTGGRFRMQRLAVDAAGNSVVQASFEGQVAINGETFSGATGRSHVLLLRYDALGASLGTFAGYATRGVSQDYGFTGVALASTGEVYLSGYLSAAATLQFGSLPALTGPSTANAAGFVVKVNANSNAAWVITTSGPPRQSTTSASGQSIDRIALGPQDRCYALGGMVGSSMSLGVYALNTGNPNGTTGQDLFLARIAPNGTVESLVGGGGARKVSGLAMGPQGDATIATAGGLEWGNVRLPGAAWPNSLVSGLVQLDAAGVPQRGWQAGGQFYTAALAVDGLNRPVLAGTYFQANNVFTFGTRQLTSPYAWNTVIARTGTALLGTQQAAQVAGLEVFPNPARRAVTVRTAQPTAFQVELLDALGRTVRAQQLRAGQAQVALDGLAAGSYTLLVQQGEARSYRHLVVEP